MKRGGALALLLVAVLLGASAGTLAAFSASTSNADNVFSASSCFGAQVQNVQSGTTTNAVNGTTTVNITSVDPTKSFLIFSTRHNSNRPGGGLLRGRLASATTLEFARVTGESPVSTITIQWSVIEYSCGVAVQRGQTTQNAATVNVSISAVSSLNRAFVTWSKTSLSGDTSWSSNEPLVADLTAADNLQFRADVAPASHIIWWQVVEFTMSGDANVQRGTTSITGTATSANIVLPTAVNPARAFVLADARGSGSGSDIGARVVRAQLTSATTVVIDRSISGSPDTLTEVTWQVIELNEGSSVQRGTAAFASGAATATAALTSIDTAWAVAFGSFQSGSGQNLGRSSYNGDDIPGVAAATTTVTSATQLTLQRDNTAAAADIAWFVVQFGACVAPGTMTLSAAADAYLEAFAPSTNYGSATTLRVTSATDFDIRRSEIQFTFPALPSRCRVTSATLRLFADSATAGRTVQVLRNASAWAESSVTVFTMPATTGTAATATSGTGWVEWDVASHVDAMYGGTNNGWQVRDAVETQTADQTFRSRENSGGSTPELVLTFG